ncbi:MAG: iron-sulfur cluster assembly accessory protein [Nitrospirae bacterium]|nr:iron-sulfur cluster assembly accessory protein [Nitrospirota bacterium]
MSKPILRVRITTMRSKTAALPALFDTGSFFSIIRENQLPTGTPILPYPERRALRTAGRRGQLRVTGVTELVVDIGRRRVQTSVLVSPDLGREFLIGAGTMQMWDISVRNRNGSTKVVVGRDVRNPEITEVAALQEGQHGTPSDPTPSQTSAPAPIRPLLSVTEKAARRILDLCKRQAPTDGANAYGIRLKVIGGGCNGMQYKMNPDTQARPGDRVFDAPLGLKVFVDLKSLIYLKGTEIDLNANPLAGTFEFKNPNVKSTCGCGLSFST